MDYELRLKELGIKIPEVPKPAGSYLPAVQDGNLVYVSGQLPMVNGNLLYKGKVTQDLSLEEAMEAAKICAINGLAAIKSITNDLNKIKKIIRLGGFVNSPSGFFNQPKVINGASDFLYNIFGEAGRHARAAVGVNELPLNTAVEIEMLVSLK